MIEIYTDGATSNNKQDEGYGGWAFVIKSDDIFYADSGAIPNSTNNICELTAIINGCKQIMNMAPSQKVVVFSDSAYCINCYKDKWYKNWMKNGWVNSKKQPVANRALWEKLIPFFESENFYFEKVKGHSDNEWNNLADKMAVEAKQCLM